MSKYQFGLCAGRHDIPVQNFIFNEVLNPTDFATMEKIAAKEIPDDADTVEVFVTGLTPAMLAVVKVCEMRKIDLIALHYDRGTGVYNRQEILSYQICPFCHQPVRNDDRICPHCGST